MHFTTNHLQKRNIATSVLVIAKENHESHICCVLSSLFLSLTENVSCIWPFNRGNISTRRPISRSCSVLLTVCRCFSLLGIFWLNHTVLHFKYNKSHFHLWDLALSLLQMHSDRPLPLCSLQGDTAGVKKCEHAHYSTLFSNPALSIVILFIAPRSLTGIRGTHEFRWSEQMSSTVLCGWRTLHSKIMSALT